MTRTSKLVATVMSIAGLATLGCDDSTDIDQIFAANLDAASEIPVPVGPVTATGRAVLTLDDDLVLRVLIRVNGNLTSPVTMAHIHGPATPTTTAPIVLDFVPSMTAVIAAGAVTGTMVQASFDLNALPVSPTGVLRVTPGELIAMLNNGTAYVNVHTVTNGAGEIRGTIVRQ